MAGIRELYSDARQYFFFFTVFERAKKGECLLCIPFFIQWLERFLAAPCTMFVFPLRAFVIQVSGVF